MQNEGTQTASLINKAIQPSELLTTILQFPVFWDDLDFSWNSTDLTWNQGTDVTALTNQTI